MIYFVLDGASDFVALDCERVSNAQIIPISAAAIAGIPSSFPKERIKQLSSLISAAELAQEVMSRVAYLWPSMVEQSNCPYYKVKQLLDSIIEKQVIVEAIALMAGEKRYISMPKQWVSADGDNRESCRFAALFMDGYPGFKAVGIQRQSVIKERLYRVARLIRRTIHAKFHGSAYGRWHQGDILVGEVGYGAANDFVPVSAQKLDMGSVVLAALLCGRFLDAAKLLFHDAPIRINPPRAERRHYYLTLTRKLIQRASSVQETIDHLPATASGKPLYYFTVNYGRLGDIAIVRSLRKRGIPCVSMQHACVGHDVWTASQYLDFWESDVKLVANQNVAASLGNFEQARRGGRYLPISLPMYRRRPCKPRWDGRSVLYVLTGFTRANTMYDNRRINDTLYLEAVERDLQLIKQRFDTRIRSHPYDLRQYDNAPANYLARSLGCTLSVQQNQFEERALVIIDSPSTILADMLLAGRPVLLINRTARLMPVFLEMANKHKIIWENIEEALLFFEQTPIEDVLRLQQAFADEFVSFYCNPSHDQSISDAIQAYLTSNKKEEACSL